MGIIIEECKKAFKSPILIGLLVLFSAFNIFLIVSDSYFKDELQVANELSKTYGLEITDGATGKLERDIQADFVKVTEITGENAADFLSQLQMIDEDLYSKEEHLFFQELQLKEVYLAQAKSIDDNYKTLDIEAIGESTIEMYGLGGGVADIMRAEYQKLAHRFEEIKANEEHREWFFLGKPYQLHSFLFRTVFKLIMFEALILIVLTTALLTTFEYENKTQLLAYSTKKGRSLMKRKLGASLITSLIFSIVLLVLTLGTYFIIFDYRHLWQSAISSALNWEYNIPYITWWDLSFWQFLMLVIAVLLVCFVLFSVITFFIATVVKNSYFTFFIFAILFALGFLLPSFMPTSSLLFLVSLFNLPIVVMNPHMLFTGNSGLTMLQYHELITVGAWSFIALILYWLAMKYMKKVDIH